MKNWMKYIESQVSSPLWGFVLLDYYHSGNREEVPSQFLRNVFSKLPVGAVNPIEFHSVLMHVCIQLLGNDFSDIMDNSISFIKRLPKMLTPTEFESILKQYDTYGMRAPFVQKLRDSRLLTTSSPIINLGKSQIDEHNNRPKRNNDNRDGKEPKTRGAKNIAITNLRGKIDFGIITIREDEFVAVLEKFQPKYYTQGLRRYEISSIPSAGGFYYCSIVRLPEQGSGRGQQVARDLIEDLKPEWLILTGIAGAVPSMDYSLGDVICASRVNDFSIRAMTENNTQEFDNRGGPMDRKVEDLLASLPAIERQMSKWNSAECIGKLKPHMKVPSISESSYYGDEVWKQKVQDSLKHHFPKNSKPRDPIVTSRTITAADTLLKNTALLKQWLNSSRSTAAIEMELPGVYLASKQPDHDYPVLAIRGISDIIGFKRAEEWTKYACSSAASFTHSLIISENIFAPKNECELDF